MNDNSLDKKDCYTPTTKTIVAINNTVTYPLIIAFLGAVLVIKLVKKNKKK